MENDKPVDLSKVSMEDVIAGIHKMRNDRIVRLLKGPALNTYLEEHYNIYAVSAIKLEFIKRDLTDLKNSSLDLVYYASLIRQVKESGITKGIGEHPLFHNELNSIFQKYNF